MDITVAVILGIIQGLTEFIPVSSSGHILLVSKLMMGGKDAGAGFTAVIQIGTLVAACIYFREDLGRILGGWWKSLFDKSLRGTEAPRLFWAIAMATVPIVIIGKASEKTIDTTLRSDWFVVAGLAVLGLLMGVSEKASKPTKTLDDLTVKDGFLMGLWQCLALVPGSSRSGSTITGGLFMGYERAAAARISFLMMIPAVALSGVYKLIKEKDTLLGAGLMPTIVATVVSFVVGYWAISFLMKYLQTKTTWPFVWYRIGLAAVIVVLLLSGIIKA